MKVKIIMFVILLVAIGGIMLWDRSSTFAPEVKNNDSEIGSKQNDGNSVTKYEGWKMYTNNDIGISFQYPDSFKSVEAKVLDGNTGQAFSDELESGLGYQILLGGVTENYTNERGGAIRDTSGYELEGEKPVAKFVWGDQAIDTYEFWDINNGNDRALVVKNTEIGRVLSEDQIAAFVNTGDPTFPGVVFVLSPINHNEMLSENDVQTFRNIVTSIELK